MLKPRLHGWNMHMVGRTGKVIDVFGEVGVRIEARAGGRLEVQGSLRAAALMGVPGAAREQARSHRSSSQAPDPARDRTVIVPCCCQPLSLPPLALYGPRVCPRMILIWVRDRVPVRHLRQRIAFSVFPAADHHQPSPRRRPRSRFIAFLQLKRFQFLIHRWWHTHHVRRCIISPLRILHLCSALRPPCSMHAARL